MYYISNNKNDLSIYNSAVSNGEGYKGVTTKWADVIEHPNGIDFAILANNKYPSSLDSVSKLSDDWFLKVN